MSSRTILIAEDTPRDREFLQHALAGYRVRFAANGREALEALGEEPAPWVISDLQMPEMNGVQLARELWRRRPEARIVFWSQHKDEVYIRALAEVVPAETVYGYVLKSNTSETLQRAVRAVFEECQCWLDPSVRPVQARTRQGDSSVNDLEYEVLVDIGLGLTDNLIAKRRYLSRRGVQNRLKSLYAKLGIDHEQATADGIGELLNLRTRALSVAMRRGLLNPYVLEQEEEKLRRWLERQNLGGPRASE
ncbi:MAG TPA: response regulator transcription factor [Thiotrichales bacterium]|nr:response regulator transcription factor [Thiotrichales bacterium]